MLDFSKLVDADHNGVVDNIDGTGQIQPGSEGAKKIWQQIDKDAHSAENMAKAKALTGQEGAKGMFMGKALVPGHAGPNEGDFNFFVNKLVWNDGYSPEVAKKIAWAAKEKLYPNSTFVPSTAVTK